MKDDLIDQDIRNSYCSTISDTSLSSIHSEPCQRENHFSSRNDFQRRSLKETILLRKFSKNGNANRWDVSFKKSPLVGDKDNLERSEFIRTKIKKNQRSLQLLLRNAPVPIRPLHPSTNSNSPMNNATKPVQALAKDHVTVRSSDVGENVFTRQSLVEDSSSDDEVRAPMDESPPNLSDDECLFLHSNTNNRNTKRVISVTRTSSRASMLSHRRGSDNSPPNPLYEAAKPRPPPRSNKKPTKENNIPPVEGILEPSQIITVPYVSRGVGKGKWSSANLSRLRRSSRSSSVTSDGDVTVVESTPSIATQKIEEVEDKPCYNDAINDVTNINNNNKVNKNAVSPSRHTVSSGYSSPGSSSTSLSPTSSNASSASSNAMALRQQNNKSRKTEKNNNVVNIPEIIGEKMSSDSAVKGTENKQVQEEDIFPVKKWVESSEYTNLQSPNNLTEFKTSPANESNRLKSPCAPHKSVCAAAHKLNASADDSKKRLSVQSADFCEKTPVKHHLPKRPTSSYIPTSQPLASKNIVSMIENPNSKKANFKTRTANLSANQHGGKQRPWLRSKKAASRNSLAFAFQARSNVEEKFENDSLAPPNSQNEPQDIRRAASLSPKAYNENPTNLLALQRELSASLANLDKAVPQARGYSTVSGATGRHMADQSNFFNDRVPTKHGEPNYCYSTQSVCTDSMWSLNPSNPPKDSKNKILEPSRKPSFRNRLKGAFSFQNIRRAISMDKLNEDDKASQRSVSHCYLNEYGEDISTLPTSKQRASTLCPQPNLNYNQPPLQKASSITSIFNTVRMRKRRSRERRAMKARNTIAVDPKQIPEYEEYSNGDLARPKSYHDISKPQEVSGPTHYRPIGRVLGMDVREGSLLVEISKPPSGPYGFYLARRKEMGETGSVYISSLSDSYHNKMFAGLMKLGDEITEINGTSVYNLTLDQVYDIILQSDILKMRIKPTQVHNV